MKKWRTKAFTLTELLVVVIVLGTLAAVAVPKMTRVLETRKTTEAEEMFSMVRAEQETRCVTGKKYSTNSADVQVLAGASHSGNYTYGLTNQGISAASAKGYTLKMPSYKNGEICCEGEYCSSLNKNYPICTDTLPKDECAGEGASEEEETGEENYCAGPSERSCGCDTKFTTAQKGTQTRTCVNGQWSDWSACSGYTQYDRQQCESGGAEEWQCVYSNGAWNWKQISSCPEEGEEGEEEETNPDKQTCSGSSSRACGCDPKFMTPAGGTKGTQTRTCVDGQWSDWSACSGYTQYDRQQCANGGGNEEYECVYSSGTWSWKQIRACQGGSGSSCTWQTVRTYLCGTEVPSSVCNAYGSQCSVNNYCPGGPIAVEACI